MVDYVLVFHFGVFYQYRADFVERFREVGVETLGCALVCVVRMLADVGVVVETAVGRRHEVLVAARVVYSGIKLFGDNRKLVVSSVPDAQPSYIGNGNNMTNSKQ